MRLARLLRERDQPPRRLRAPEPDVLRARRRAARASSASSRRRSCSPRKRSCRAAGRGARGVGDHRRDRAPDRHRPVQGQPACRRWPTAGMRPRRGGSWTCCCAPAPRATCSACAAAGLNVASSARPAARHRALRTHRNRRAEAEAAHRVGRVHLAPDGDRRPSCGGWGTGNGANGFPLRMIGLRELRSHNSWMHNAPLLMRGERVHALRVHPDDADEHGLKDGGQARLESKSGAVDVPVAVTDEMTPGAVALPHGWGHSGGWMRRERRAGVNVNLLASWPPDDLEALAGMAHLNGIPVRLPGQRPASAAGTRHADGHRRPLVGAVDHELAVEQLRTLTHPRQSDVPGRGRAERAASPNPPPSSATTSRARLAVERNRIVTRGAVPASVRHGLLDDPEQLPSNSGGNSSCRDLGRGIQAVAAFPDRQAVARSPSERELLEGVGTEVEHLLAQPVDVRAGPRVLDQLARPGLLLRGRRRRRAPAPAPRRSAPAPVRRAATRETRGGPCSARSVRR